MSGKILVVDDEKENVILLIGVLGKFGYETESALDVETAIEMIKTGRFQLVITDKNMPGIEYRKEGGMDILKFIKENAPSMQVMMMTGYATVATAIEAMKLGAFDYLTKPFSIMDLKKKVDRVMEYRSFLNPDQTIDTYQTVHNEALELLDEVGYSDDGVRQHKMLSSFDDKLDVLFKCLKGRESFIIEQREALTEIAGLAEQLKDELSGQENIMELVEGILEQTRKRV